jgi:hypothetical protein
VRTGEQVVAVTTSERVARVLARLLNGEEVEPAAVEEQSLLDRYSVSRNPRGDRWVVTADPYFPASRYGSLFRAVATTEPVARRLAERLNEVDPAPRPKVRRFWPF